MPEEFRFMRRQSETFQEKKSRCVKSWRRRRALLKKKLGGKCAWCSARAKLQFDHKYGRDWDPSKVNRWTRIARYWREAEEGLIQMLCQTCNINKGNGREPEPEALAS